MESKNLIFKNGHFYDVQSMKRIKIKDGAEVCIVASSNSFEIANPAGTILEEPKSSAALLNEIKSDKEISSYSPIKKKGELLYFYIDHDFIQHEFQVELLEDLYLFTKSKWKKQDARLYDCACVVRKNFNHSISFFEEVSAKSLNEVYKNTFVHYFGNEGNPACNAIDRFYQQPHNAKTNLRIFRLL